MKTIRCLTFERARLDLMLSRIRGVARLFPESSCSPGEESQYELDAGPSFVGISVATPSTDDLWEPADVAAALRRFLAPCAIVLWSSSASTLNSIALAVAAEDPDVLVTDEVALDIPGTDWAAFMVQHPDATHFAGPCPLNDCPDKGKPWHDAYAPH